MQNQKVIEQLGYSPKEAKVYLMTLTSGEARVTDIAQKTNLPRTTVQVIVDKLYKAGLLNFYKMRRFKYWVAVNPEHLLDNLSKQETMVKEALPKLIELKKQGRVNSKNHKVNKNGLGHIQLVADEALQAVLVTNDKVAIQYVNSAWEKQLGYHLNEVKGKYPDILKSDKTPSSVYEKMWQCLTANRMFQSEEIIDKRKDGTIFNLRTTIFILIHNEQKFYIQILDDIDKADDIHDLHQSFLAVE